MARSPEEVVPASLLKLLSTYLEKRNGAQSSSCAPFACFRGYRRFEGVRRFPAGDDRGFGFGLFPSLVVA